jgi:hypothetical protein
MPAPFPDLYAAAAAWLKSDADLTAAFPGGFVCGRGTVAIGYPYVRVRWRKPEPGPALDMEQWRLVFTVYALNEDDAADRGELLEAKFLDEARPQLEYTDRRARAWREACRVEQEAEGPDWVGTLAATGPESAEGDVWRWRQGFDVHVVRAE